MSQNYLNSFERVRASYYSESSYYVKSGNYKNIISRLESENFGSETERFEHYCFAMIKPDTVVSGKVLKLCNWLQNNGININYCQPIFHYHERHCEDLYKYNLTLRNEHNQISSWWINRQLYTFSPCIVLLLSSSQHDSNVYRLLSKLKGPSDPYLGKDGELRHELGATNMTMNLFHCSDDPLSTMREFLIYNSINDLKDVINLISTESHQDSFLNPYVNINQQISLFESCTVKNIDTDAISTVYKILLRLSIAAKNHHVAALLFKEFPTILPMPNKEKIRGCIKILNSVAHVLTQSAPLTSATDLHLSTMLQLCKFPFIEEPVVEKLLHIADSLNVKTSEWEKLILVSTVHYRADIKTTLESDSKLTVCRSVSRQSS